MKLVPIAVLVLGCLSLPAHCAGANLESSERKPKRCPSKRACGDTRGVGEPHEAGVVLKALPINW